MTSALRMLVVLAVGAFSGVCLSAPNADDCSGTERWATSLAFLNIKNARLTDNDKLDFKNTKTVRLASEKIGKDLFREVHYANFTANSERRIEVIAVNDVSSDECSMPGVQVFVVSQQLGTRVGALSEGLGHTCH